MRRTITIIAMFLALVFLGFLLFSAWTKQQALVYQLESLQRDNSSMIQENESAEKIISDIGGSDIVKELEVRRKLNYSKPGEVLVVFVSPSPVPNSSKEPSFLERVRDFFKK